MKRALAVAAMTFGFAAPALAAMSAQEFVDAAANSGLFEIKSSQAALDQKVPTDVADFAQKMIVDHTKANDELMAVAKGKDVTVPESLDAKHQETLDEVEGMQGEDFVKGYVDAQVKGHEETVETFQAYAKEGDDADLTGFASKTLPTLQEHLDMAKQIQGKMGGS
ncbi:MAG: DUF4142 domain-containing protein [Geminicoccaceae bacterium]|nr:DUF4142 domain-containing protein [Geminicoccaceae bacterium]